MNWLSKCNGKVVTTPIEQLTIVHIKKAYWWGCKRYTKYHNEIINDNNINFNKYMTLYSKLREMESIAIKRNITLNTPPIALIRRDRKYYWKTVSVNS